MTEARVPVTDDALVEKVARAILEQESEQIVRDMASHVGDEIHAVLKRHGMMMTTTGGTVAVGILAAIQVLAETVAFARRSMDGDAEDEAAIVQAAMKLFAIEATAAIPEFAAIAYPAGVAAGREEAAKIATAHQIASFGTQERALSDYSSAYHGGAGHGAKAIAAAIRQMGGE